MLCKWNSATMWKNVWNWGKKNCQNYHFLHCRIEGENFFTQGTYTYLSYGNVVPVQGLCPDLTLQSLDCEINLDRDLGWVTYLYITTITLSLMAYKAYSKVKTSSGISLLHSVTAGGLGSSVQLFGGHAARIPSLFLFSSCMQFHQSQKMYQPQH